LLPTKEGAKTREAALDYVNALRLSRRYQRDVY
jgi:sulfite reductase alpha subunit-like flavoprotein